MDQVGPFWKVLDLADISPNHKGVNYILPICFQLQIEADTTTC